MDDNIRHHDLSRKSPLFQLFISLLIIVGIGTVLLLVFVAAGLLIYDADPALLKNISLVSQQNEISFLRYIIVSQQIALFLIPGVILFFLLNKGKYNELQDLMVPSARDIIMVVILVFCVFPVTMFAGLINSAMDLPEWLSGVEKWMTDKENNVAQLFELIMVRDSWWILLTNLLMIAVIPAIGEELIFRGILQKLLYKIFRTSHMAIWVTAVIFSAIHFQFYGFLPRLILGLLFGYLFYWSRTLWLPVVAHFVNNAVPVAGAFFQGWEKYGSASDMSIAEQLIRLPVPVMIGIFILIYLRRNSLKKREIFDDQVKNFE
jgi:membrane protease YdiL (CAAX protease family)